MSFFSAVSELLHPAPAPDENVRRALDRVCELVDPLLRTVGSFEKKLSGPVHYALGYCDGLVASLPGPVEISRPAFSNDPLIHSLFATATDIDQMLGRSQAIRDYLAEPCSWEDDYFYAMLAARRQEKKQLGMAQQGDVIRNDVPQTVLYFSGQTLIEPNCQLEATLHGLRCKTFESLLHTFRSHVEALRGERDGLRADVTEERNHITVLNGHSSKQAYDCATRHLAELDAQLRAKAESLMPEHLIDALADYLMSPEPALRLTPVSLTVDRLGVIQNVPADDASVHTITFPELTARDRRLHLAMLARISRDEALEAVEMVRDEQHRFMII